MSISGNLKTMELAELLQWLSHSQKTGTLLIDGGTVQKRVFFENGKIVSSASSEPKEHLGHFLVSHGYIDEDTLVKVMEMQKINRMLLGKILITVGAISEEDLNKMLRLKAEESIYDIFTWTEGDFSFSDDVLPDLPMVPITIDVTGIVFEGARRLDEWKLIGETIPSMQAVPVAVRELAPSEEFLSGQSILDHVNDDRTVEEIAIETHSSEFYTCRVLFDQVQKKNLKLVRPRRIVSEPVAIDTERDEIDSAALLRTATNHMESLEFGIALRHLEAAQALEPHNNSLHEQIKVQERRIEEELKKAGVVLSAVPKLTRPASELVDLDITPEQGFVLSRIDGSYNIETILKISPDADAARPRRLLDAAARRSHHLLNRPLTRRDNVRLVEDDLAGLAGEGLDRSAPRTAVGGLDEHRPATGRQRVNGAPASGHRPFLDALRADRLEEGPVARHQPQRRRAAVREVGHDHLERRFGGEGDDR